MKKILALFVIALLAGIYPAYSAQRVVLYEHFTQDMCTSCPAVAATIQTLRETYPREQIVIISYSVQGSAAVPDGFNRLDHFGLSTVPVVIGDGIQDFTPPVEVSQLSAFYSSRSGIASSARMEVFHEGGSQYRIHIEAESAINAKLMAVAYSETTHEDIYFPVFAREILTNYWGDDVSIPAGGSLDITKTVTCGLVSGVVAWLETSQKSDHRIRTHETIQAADSNASHSNPTPTVTPTPTQGTPTPTPTTNPDGFNQKIVMSSDLFRPNDMFVLDIRTQNPTTSPVTVDQYIALQVLDQFYFWPEWTTQLGSEKRTFLCGHNDTENIFEFAWPHGVGSFSGLVFWLVSLNEGTTDLACPFDFATFGYTQ